MHFAVISDIHSDLPSLDKALKKINKLDCQQVICLGDIVGYNYHYSESLDGRDPDACIDLVRKQCHFVIRGNHDLHALKKIPENHVDLGMPDNWYELTLKERAAISTERFWLYDDEIEHTLSGDSKKYLEMLPESMIVKTGKIQILCTHFIAPDITGSTQSSPVKHSDFKSHLRLLKQKNCFLGMAGHAHLEGYAMISKKKYHLNYFRKENLMKEPQILLVPAITRGGGRNGFLIIDPENRTFEAIPLD